MIKVVFSALCLTLLFFGCSKKVEVITKNIDTSGSGRVFADSLTYLALGDSYTIGEVVTQQQSFPYQLRELLNNSPDFSVEAPTIIATTGWTTDELLDAITTRLKTPQKYDFVTLLIGVNDEFQGLSQNNYRIKFTEALDSAITFAQGDSTRVFVLSIPDWGVTPYAEGQDSIIGPQIDQFNAINKAISLKAGVHYVDITPISREAATDPSLIAIDGLHPSGKMYGLWMQLLYPLVLARLEKN